MGQEIDGLRQRRDRFHPGSLPNRQQARARTFFEPCGGPHRLMWCPRSRKPLMSPSTQPGHRTNTKRLSSLLVVLTMTIASTMLLPTTPVAAQTTPPSPPAEFATPCPEMTDSVYRLYSAYFLRLPDQGGYDFWIRAYASGDYNLTTMSDFFASSPEFQQRYGSLDNQQFVELVYANVLRRTPDREGFFFWLDELDSGRVSRGGLMSFFSESEEFVALTGTVRPLAGYLNAYPEGTIWACGQGAAEGPRYLFNEFVDLYVLNVGASSASARIELLNRFGDVRDSGDWTLPVNNEVYVSSFAPTPDITTIVFDVDPNVIWISVSYPVSIGESRPGWGFRTQGGANMAAAIN